MKLQRDDCVPKAVVRLMGDGAVVGLNGDWPRLCPALRFGCSAFEVISKGLQEGLKAAMAEPHATRFRLALGAHEWLFHVEPDGEGFILQASMLPAMMLGSEAPHQRVGRFMDDAPLHVSVADALDS